MVQFTPEDLKQTLDGLRRPLWLTRFGMRAEGLVRSLWPLLTVMMLALAAAMMGLHELLPVEAIWACVGLTAGAALWALVYAVLHWSWSSTADAMLRLDGSMVGRPITALLDDQAIGGSDDASAAVWRVHKRRMAERAAKAQAVRADLRVSSRDPYALRYVAALAFGIALVFGSIWRVGTVAEIATGGAGTLAAGPVWEGWAEPPRYTGKPTLYLNDQSEGALELPVGTIVTMRLYGEVGALTVAETVSGNSVVAEPEAPPQMAFDFKVTQDGMLAIDGPGARAWDVTVRADEAPEIVILGAPEVEASGEMRLPFAAKDDYGVEAGEARITLDLASVDRRYGLATGPDPRVEVTVPLPMPIAGDRAAFEENLIDDFSEHPWANLPVTVVITALDAAEQQAHTALMQMTLPGRRFFDPTAAAVIEMRRDLLWSRSNAKRTAQVLRAVSYLPQNAFRKETTALRLRKMIGRIEIYARFGLDFEDQDQLAQDMWDLALELEEGDLEDARERMKRAQERLNEAMKNGATNEEIAELMQELRRATEDFMQQLQREQAERQDGEQEQGQQQQQGETMQMTQDDLQRMMDRIQKLMEEGRMAEAEQALKELQEMMENMQMAEGQQGQGSQSPGQEAMEGLAETLREQQGLSDQAFRDLQEQFNPDAQAGESQQNEGRNGGQGRGENHEGQQGQSEGQQEQQHGEQGGGGEQREGEGQAQGQGTEQSLAERQQQLRDELNRQEGNMPGQGTPEGDAAREALDRAGEAMDQAEQNLREGDLADAIDNQSQAMEALRDSMRSLGEAMAEEERNQQAGQGQQDSDRRADNRDPLGRSQGSNGATGSDEQADLNDDAYGRARELLDEIRRRSGETARPEVERDYLNRLLDRF
jgi:uncharacterized protein (TIGR02302 family)